MFIIYLMERARARKQKELEESHLKFIPQMAAWTKADSSQSHEPGTSLASPVWVAATLLIGLVLLTSQEL